MAGDTPHARGQWGEDVAADALRAHGYMVITRNYRAPGGEIDVIARDGEAWVFVEVKLRTGDSFGSPEEAITPAKARRLLTAAHHYIAEHELEDIAWRVDVVAIERAPSGKVQRLALYRAAVVDAGD